MILLVYTSGQVRALVAVW